MVAYKRFNFLKLNPDIQFALFLLAHIVVWTLIPAIDTRLIYGDMAEMFIWGKEWEWGYHKHPPFAPWVSAAWFYLFPTTNFFYFLLSQINLAVGFIFSYLLSKEFLPKSRALAAILLLELLMIHFRSTRFNNDAILLSMWPVCSFFMFKAFKYDKKIYWFLAGTSAGIAVLSKYYSIALLAAMFLIFIFNNRPNPIKALLKPGPIVSLITFIIVVSQHLNWLLEYDFMPFKYAQSRDNHDYVIKAISFIAVHVLILLPTILIGRYLFKLRYKQIFTPSVSNADTSFLSGVVYIPFVATVIIAIVCKYTLSVRFGIPLWFLFSTFIIAKVKDFSDKYIQTISVIVYTFLAVALILALIAKIFIMQLQKQRYFYPAQQISSIITNEWRDAYKTKLKYVAGYDFSAYDIAFFSPDHPSVLINFDYKISTWIKNEDQIKKNGTAIICYYYQNDVYDNNQTKSCVQAAENTFKWATIDWKNIRIGKYYFEYAFIGPFL